MKKDLHPTYHQTTVVCACGNSFATGSTQETLKVEICSNCHPFFTGKQNLVDTAGRVDRFELLKQKSEAMKASRTKAKTTRAKKTKKTVSKKTRSKKDA